MRTLRRVLLGLHDRPAEDRWQRRGNRRRVNRGRTRAERQARRDPRPSIEERSASRAAYLSRVRGTADALLGFGYLLAEDVESVRRRSADHGDLLARQPTPAVSSR